MTLAIHLPGSSSSQKARIGTCSSEAPGIEDGKDTISRFSMASLAAHRSQQQVLRMVVSQAARGPGEKSACLWAYTESGQRASSHSRVFSCTGNRYTVDKQ